MPTATKPRPSSRQKEKEKEKAQSRQGQLVRRYPEELKALARRAEELRGRPRTVGPVQVQRVKEALGSKDPLEALGMPIGRAKEYASGKVGIPRDERKALRDFSDGFADPFCRGRGAAAILLALAGK